MREGRGRERETVINESKRFLERKTDRSDWVGKIWEIVKKEDKTNIKETMAIGGWVKMDEKIKLE